MARKSPQAAGVGVPRPSDRADGGLIWTTQQPEPEALRKVGWSVVAFADVRRMSGITADGATARRQTLDLPAREWLDIVRSRLPTAVLGVPARTGADLHDIYGYLVEPAYRSGTPLLIHADRELDRIKPDRAIEQIGYAWSLQRLQYIAERWRLSSTRGSVPLTPIEQLLYDAMRSKGLHPIPQFGIGKLRVDFAIDDARIAVEADGRPYHDPARDAVRDDRLRRLTWEPIHFTGSEITRDPARCAEKVVALSKTRLAILRTQAVEFPSEERSSWWKRALAWIAQRLRRQPQAASPGADEELDVLSVPPRRSDAGQMDDEQHAAAVAPDGVVQVIAPAGSGKTSVLIERVRELRSRGVAQNRILCCTFNRAAVDELRQRLVQEGMDAVEVRTFHGIGRMVLDDAALLRVRLSATTHGQWRWLAKQAKDANVDGVWLEPHEAQQVVSDLKLDRMLTPAEYREEVDRLFGAAPTADEVRERRNVPGGRERTMAALYQRHEDMLERDDRLDFDDLVLRSVRLLQDDSEVRAKWQGRFTAVLVDEYQDIEPAQELLVRVMAAPEDILFVVGDEDQCIYSWRRASVERVVELDRLYPGLSRVALKRNYRCPILVVEASRRLIEHNLRRFPKAIEPAIQHPGRITLVSATDEKSGAAHIARLLTDARKGDAAVLARTTRALTEVATGLARAGIRFWAAEHIRSRLLNLSGEPGVLLAYIRLLAHPTRARPEDVDQVFRVPNRYLPPGKEADVAQGLRTGMSFSQALARLRVDDWRREKLTEAGTLFDAASKLQFASELIALLRDAGGLDRHYTEAEQLSPMQQDATDSLERAQHDSEGYSVSDYAEMLDYRSHIIEQHFEEAGVELATIHGAKGRQWPLVIVASFDEDELPHARSLENSEDEADALEAERRLAYVAMTRARDHLVMVHGNETASRFISEAAPRADVVTAVPVPDARARSTKPKEAPASRDESPSSLIDSEDRGWCGTSRFDTKSGSRLDRPAELVEPALSADGVIAVRLSGGSAEGLADPVARAIAGVLALVPRGSLSATMLTHVLRGSQGPKTQELIKRYGLSQYAEFGHTPFSDLRLRVIELASGTSAFELVQPPSSEPRG